MKKIVIAFLILAASAPAFAQSYTGKLQGKKVITESIALPAGVAHITISTNVFIDSMTATVITGGGAGITNLTPANMSAGSLPSTVIASSIAVGAVNSNAINDLDAAKLTGTINNSRIDGSSVTLRGNTFNGAEQLVLLGSDGKLPAIDGSQLTGLPSTSHSHQYSGNNFTLGVGTFSYTTPSENISLRRITATITSSGEGGSFTYFACGINASSNYLEVAVPASATEGSTYTSTAGAPKAVTAGSAIMLQMSRSDQSITPSANVVCEYN